MSLGISTRVQVGEGIACWLSYGDVAVSCAGLGMCATVAVDQEESCFCLCRSVLDRDDVKLVSRDSCTKDGLCYLPNMCNEIL